MQLAATAVTPPAEHAARRPAGAADTAADADVRATILGASFLLELLLTIGTDVDTM